MSYRKHKITLPLSLFLGSVLRTVRMRSYIGRSGLTLRRRYKPGLQRNDQALEKARRTCHCVVQQDVHGELIGVSLPIPQLYVQSPFGGTLVSSAIEMEIRHSDSYAYDTFLARYVLPRQIALLAQANGRALIYAVPDANTSHEAILREHGWVPFEPEFELVLSREQTGVKYDCDKTWLKCPE